MAADIYQILIQVKNLAQLREFNKIGKAMAPIQTRAARGVKGTGKAVTGLTGKTYDLNRLMKQQRLMAVRVSGEQDKVGKRYLMTSKNLDRYGKIIGATMVSQDGLTKTTLKTTKRFQDMRQIIGKVAFWAVATTAIYGTQKALRAVWQMTQEYAQGLARVSSVIRGTSRDLSMVSQTIIGYASTSTAALKDVTKAMYHLFSAGMSVREAMVGLKPVMDLTVGTFGNIDQVARLVAGSYNVFGKQMKNLITPAEKLRYISDTLAFYYSKEQVELSEIAGAMTLVGSAAGMLDIDYKTLIATIGELNTGMLRGTRAGTCYDDKTEVLTKDGFKYWKDISMEDVFATLNPNSHELEYQKPSRIIDEKYEGLMYKATNQHLSLLVTGNHRIYTKKGQIASKSKYEAIQAKDIFGQCRTYIRGAKWKGKAPKYFILPSVEMHYGGYNHKSDRIKIKTNDWVQFLAWWLSEGSSSIYKPDSKATNYKVVIYQNGGKERDEIRKLLGLLPFKFYENHPKDRTPSFVINSKPLYTYLKQFGLSHDKFLPQFVKNLSPKLLKLFISIYNKGDGRREIRGTTFEITTNSTKMRDDLEEIGLKAGYGVSHSSYNGQGSFNSNYPIWKIYISRRTEFSFDQPRNIKCAQKYNRNPVTEEKWIPYSGRIYCCEVPNHIVFIRREGKTVWCMNSLTNSFIKVARNADRLKQHFGVMFDPTQPMNFVNIMNQLYYATKGTADTTETLGKLMDVFGIRGARAVQSLLNRFEEWQESINATDETFSDFAEDMRYKVEYTLGNAFKKLGATLKTEIIKTLEGDPGLGYFNRAFHHIMATRKGLDNMGKAMKALGVESKQLGSDLGEMGRAVWVRALIGKFRDLFQPLDTAVTLVEKLGGVGKVASEEFAYLGIALGDVGLLQHIITEGAKEGVAGWVEQVTAVRKYRGILEGIVRSSEPLPEVLERAAIEIAKMTGKSEELLKSLLTNKTVMEHYADLRKEATSATEMEKAQQDRLLESTAKQLRKVRQSAKYIMLGVKGYSTAYIINQKILDAQKEISIQLDKGRKIIAEAEKAQTEALAEGKELSKKQLEILKSRNIVDQVGKYLKGEVVSLTEKELLAAQKVGLETKSVLDLQRLINKAKAEGLEQARSYAEWYATTTDEARAQADEIERAIKLGEARGRIPYFTRTQKDFIKKHPAMMKKIEEESTVPINIIVSEDSYRSLELWKRKKDKIISRAKEEMIVAPTPRAPVGVFAPSIAKGTHIGPAGERAKINIPEWIVKPTISPNIVLIMGPEGIITEQNRREWNEMIRTKIIEELGEEAGAQMEEHEAATSKTGR